MVGYATGNGLSRTGHQVSFYDLNPQTVNRLKNEGLPVAKSLEEAVGYAQAVMLCLPTPLSDQGFDLSSVYHVAEELVELLESQTVMIRSTVLPGTTRKLSSILPAERLVYNPEFLREAHALDDFLHPYRIVVGAESEAAFRAAEALYANFDAPTIKCGWEAAEMGKLVSNAFLADKISFFNEFWLFCQKLGLDCGEVETIAALDERIGFYGTKGGMPFQGSCLPKDTEALVRFANTNGENLAMLESALEVNERVKSRATVSSATPAATTTRAPPVEKIKPIEANTP